MCETVVGPTWRRAGGHRRVLAMTLTWVCEIDCPSLLDLQSCCRRRWTRASWQRRQCRSVDRAAVPVAATSLAPRSGNMLQLPRSAALMELSTQRYHSYRISVITVCSTHITISNSSTQQIAHVLQYETWDGCLRLPKIYLKLLHQARQHFLVTPQRLEKIISFNYVTCIYNACKFSNDTQSEVLAVTRWAAW